MRAMPVQGELLGKVVAAMRRIPMFRSMSEDQARQAAEETRLLQLEPGEELARQAAARVG